jgi:hypothetical protein
MMQRSVYTLAVVVIATKSASTSDCSPRGDHGPSTMTVLSVGRFYGTYWTRERC